MIKCLVFPPITINVFNLYRLDALVIIVTEESVIYLSICFIPYAHASWFDILLYLCMCICMYWQICVH